MEELIAESIQKSFGTKQLLTDVFISCKPGEIVGLLGRNGTGKSTLMKIIFGALPAENKFIKADGYRINNVYDSKDKITYLPQYGFLPQQVKIKKLVALFADKALKEELLENNHIKPFLNKYANSLSGGEERLIEILLAIHSTARYVLMDEPFNELSPMYKEEVKYFLKRQAKSKGFIISDHDYRNILDVSDRTVLLFDGGTKMMKSVEELVYWGYTPERTRV